MHLQQHARLQPGIAQRLRHADHGALDDVGGRALQRRVDRLAFAEGAFGAVGRLDLRQPDFPAEDRLDIAMLAAEGAVLLHVVLDAGEFLEVLLDVGGGFLARDGKLPREAEAGDAVDDAEVDRLGLTADHRVHALHGHVEHLARRHRVNVDAIVEGLAQARNVGDVGEQAQFDLRVVSREQDIARGGDEGFADLAAFFGADRDVLQVGIGGGEAAGLRACQRVRRVHAAGVLVDRLAQRLGVGRAQLGQHAPVEHHLG